MYPDHPPAGSDFRRDLPRWRQLVTPAWLAQLVAGLPVAAAPAGAWQLIEVGCGGAAEHARGHIGQAAYLDTRLLEAPPLFNKVDDAALLAVLLSYGITHDSTVILYGRSSIAAARAAHLLLYAGVADVRLLDGGFPAWCAAGLPVASGAGALPAPAAQFGAPLPGRPEFMIGKQGAAALLAQADGTLASIRTWSEFSGLTSGYSYIPARGDIAGAVWGHAGREGDVNSMSAFQHDDGRMRAAADIARLWQGSAIDAQRQVGFYCGTGWRASLAFFYAWLMGWERISVYDGGWFEWSGDLACPVRLPELAVA